MMFNELDGRFTAHERQAFQEAQSPMGKERIRQRALRRGQRRWLNSHRHQIHRQMQRHATEKKIRDKYVWLARYHDDFLQRLGAKFKPLLVGTL
jgi:hypothetical protein